MSAGDSPLSLITGAERYIAGQISMRVATRNDAASIQLRNLLECIRTAPHISQAEGTEVLEHLQIDSGTFDADQRAELAVAVTTRQTTLQAADATTSTGTQTQVHLHLHKYYPDWLWRIILSDDTMDNKLVHMGEYWVTNLGLCYPDESTKRLGAAIVQIASNAAVDADLGYRQLHDLQAIVARKRGSTAGSLRRFPADPNTFWYQYPTTYTVDHPPAPCRIDATLLAHRSTKDAIPARSTNKRVTAARARAQKATAPPTPARTDTMETKDMFQMMMAFMLGGNKNSGNIVDMQPRLSSSVPLPMRDRTRAAVAQDTPAASSDSAVVVNAAPTIPAATSAPPLAILERAARPANAGGLPSSVLSAPPQTPSSTRMAEIRANIAAAVKKQRTSADADTADDDDAVAAAADDGDAEVAAVAAAVDAPAVTAPVTRWRLWGKGPSRRLLRIAARTSTRKAGPPKRNVGPSKRVAPKRKRASRKPIWTSDPASQLLMRKLPATARPKYNESPTKYKGGRIHFDLKRSRFRVYIRSSDKIEVSVQFVDSNKKDAFQYACGLIENGGRP